MVLKKVRGAVRLKKTDPVQRFFRKVSKPDDRGCINWTASRDTKGYGRFELSRRTVMAHRYAWTLVHGDPGSEHVLHRCDNPSCVNVEHLFLGDPQANAEDRDAKGRGVENLKALARGRAAAKATRDRLWARAYVLAKPLWDQPYREWPASRIKEELAAHGIKYSLKTLYNRLGTREDAQNG